jgi:arginyl-tRNA synthetase
MRKDISEVITEMLQESIQKAACEKGISLDGMPQVEIERGRREGQGDWASNAAMQFSRFFGEKPVEVARRIVSHLPEDPLVERVEVAGPGFINFFLSRSWMTGII